MDKKGFIPLDKNKYLRRDYLTGFTLIEILVATLLLALVTTGLAYVFVAGKRHTLHTRSKIQATELGRLFLAPLQMDVTMSERSPGAQNGWGQANNCLTGGAGCPPAQTMDNIAYTPTYDRTLDSPIGNLNKVKLTLTWNEPAP